MSPEIARTISRRRFALLVALWSLSVIGASILSACLAYSRKREPEAPSAAQESQIKRPSDGVGKEPETPTAQKVPAANKRSSAHERLLRNARAFHTNWLPIAGNAESAPYEPPTRLRFRRPGEHKEELYEMLQLKPAGEYLLNRQCHGIVRMTGLLPYFDEYLLVTAFFFTQGLVVETLDYPVEKRRKQRSAFRLAIREPVGSAERLRVTRTYYGPPTYALLSGALEENDIDILPSVKMKTYGPLPRRPRRTIPTPKGKAPLLSMMGMNPHADIPYRWHVEISAREEENKTWEHDFTVFGVLLLRDQRYTRIFLAFARVSPPLADRMGLPIEWRKNDPEPLRVERFPAVELPKRVWEFGGHRPE